MSDANGKVVEKKYTNFRGVDFSSDDTKVNISRSPNAINVWKDYNSALGQAIETRVGFKIVHHFTGAKVVDYEFKTKILKLHSYVLAGKKYFVIHVAEYDTVNSKYIGKFFQWTNYGRDEDAVMVQIIPELETYTEPIGAEKSTGFIFNDAYYILDGINCLKLNDNEGTVKYTNIMADAFVPTTFLVKPDGTAEAFQAFNRLTGKQKNQFTPNGTTKEYRIRPQYVDRECSEIKIIVNGVAIEAAGFTYLQKDDKGNHCHKLKLTTAPTNLATMVVEFNQLNDSPEIIRCDKVVVYDNRVFLANAPTIKREYYWSALNDPTYFPYYNFEHAGNDNDLQVASLILMSDGIALIKNGQGQNACIYNISGVKTGDDTAPTVYANKLVSSNIGGYIGTNFLNDIVYLGKYGLEGITRLDLHNERNTEHRSTMVDGKLSNELNLNQAKMCVYRGYLIILINGKCYLADSRQRFSSELSSLEYEWYFWNNIGVYQKDESSNENNFCEATELCEFDDKLFLGTTNGCVCQFKTDMLKCNQLNMPIGTGELVSSAYSDESLVEKNGAYEVIANVIYSCWTTPFDDFGFRNRLKRCNKKGAMADLKSFSHSICKLALRSNRQAFGELKRHNGGYFDFGDMDFEDFTFNTDEKNVFYFKPKYKKWERLSIMFYSDELRKPFGIFGVNIEAYVMGYAKGG